MGQTRLVLSQDDEMNHKEKLNRHEINICLEVVEQGVIDSLLHTSVNQAGPRAGHGLLSISFSVTKVGSCFTIPSTQHLWE